MDRSSSECNVCSFAATSLIFLLAEPPILDDRPFRPKICNLVLARSVELTSSGTQDGARSQTIVAAFAIVLVSPTVDSDDAVHRRPHRQHIVLSAATLTLSALPMVTPIGVVIGTGEFFQTENDCL